MLAYDINNIPIEIALNTKNTNFMKLARCNS